MAINLADLEKGEPYPGDYDADLRLLQLRLARVQIAYREQGKTAIIACEGWDAAGKGGAIKRACAELDPRSLYVYPIGAPTTEEKAHHFLWRFWNRLPGAGEIAIFDRSWYGRVLVERVEGLCSETDVQRAYDEINEFEAQLAFNGIAVVKLFFHITQLEQDERLRDRLSQPWKRWKVNAEDFRNRARRDDYLAATADMFKLTDTHWAPWKAIDANDKQTARISALSHMAEQLEKKVSMDPPAIPADIAGLANKALGEGTFRPD